MTTQKSCLIVDDSRVIREIAVRIIADLGFETGEASDAAAAIEYCRSEKPALVLLDWDLPSMGALDFLKAAAEFPPEEKPEIILSATENDPQQFMLAKAAGAAHHVLKPFDRDLLAEKISELDVRNVTTPKAAANQ